MPCKQELSYRPSSTQVPRTLEDEKLTQGAPVRVHQQERYVWLLARPVQALGNIGHGNFPFCHWTVLISLRGWHLDDARNIVRDLQSGRKIQNTPLGIIQEIVVVPNSSRTTLRGRDSEFGTHDFLTGFSRSSLAYVGITSLSDEEIYSYGTPRTNFFLILI